MITPLKLVYLGHNWTYILKQLIIIIITDIVTQLQVFCDEFTSWLYNIIRVKTLEVLNS